MWKCNQFSYINKSHHIHKPCIWLLLRNLKASFNLFWDDSKCKKTNPCKTSSETKPSGQGSGYPICGINLGWWRWRWSDRFNGFLLLRFRRYLHRVFIRICRWTLRGRNWWWRLWWWSYVMASSCMGEWQEWCGTKDSSHVQDKNSNKFGSDKQKYLTSYKLHWEAPPYPYCEDIHHLIRLSLLLHLWTVCLSVTLDNITQQP